MQDQSEYLERLCKAIKIANEAPAINKSEYNRLIRFIGYYVDNYGQPAIPFDVNNIRISDGAYNPEIRELLLPLGHLAYPKAACTF